MSLSQPGANYRNQSELQRRDHILGQALDDLASQVAATRNQGGFGQGGSPQPPAPPVSISVTAGGGFASLIITNPNAESSVLYVLEYSTTSNFQTPVRVQLGQATANGSIVNWHQYLTGLTLYFRAATQLPSSALSQWTYFGPADTPTAVTF